MDTIIFFTLNNLDIIQLKDNMQLQRTITYMYIVCASIMFVFNQSQNPSRVLQEIYVNT